MRRVHPLWRGFFLSLLWVMTLLFTGGADWLAPYQGNRHALTFGATIALGAALTALPSLRRRRAHRPRPRWTRLLVCFLCGMAMILSCGMAGTGRILPALMEGSSGAFAFTGAAAVTALITGRLASRRAD